MEAFRLDTHCVRDIDSPRSKRYKGESILSDGGVARNKRFES